MGYRSVHVNTPFLCRREGLCLATKWAFYLNLDTKSGLLLVPYMLLSANLAYSVSFYIRIGTMLSQPQFEFCLFCQTGQFVSTVQKEKVKGPFRDPQPHPPIFLQES